MSLLGYIPALVLLAAVTALLPYISDENWHVFFLSVCTILFLVWMASSIGTKRRR